MRSALARISFWDPLPFAQVVRTEEPIILTTAEETLAQFPHVETTGWTPRPNMVFPLMSPTRCIGAVAVDFGRPLESGEQLGALAPGLADILALYFLTRQSRPQPDDSKDSPASPRHRNGDSRRSSVDADSGELTPRQKTVLFLMSQGLSNTQIAFRIGYSESTVRHETMAIFNYFGVAGRHEAIEVARIQGLLDQPTQ